MGSLPFQHIQYSIKTIM